MKSPCFQLVCAATACVLLSTGSSAAAADPATVTTTEVVKEAALPAPPITFQILHQDQVRDGSRTVILNRVAPPVLPVIATPVAPSALSPEARKALQDRGRKEQLMLTLSATVYDHRVTELRWFGKDRSFIVWSNIDFNDIAGMGGFETDEAFCSMIIGIGNESSDALVERNRKILARGLPDSLIKTLPEAERFPQDRSGYFFAGENGAESCDPKTLAALDALHRYYDAHRAALQQARLDREAQRVENERWQKEHPPVRQNTVINFWPAGNTVILEKQSMGGKP